MFGRLVQGQDESTILRMKNIFRALGVLMVPLTASMPQVGLTDAFSALTDHLLSELYICVSWTGFCTTPEGRRQ